MKILQTYWSAPARLNDGDDVAGRRAGGWLSERFHAISWALSCLNFKKFYPELTLYTDRQGADWLINKLGLPYKNVHQELDCLNSYDPLLWALPKVYVYGKQNEPFIHADGDVFIWKKFDPSFEKSSLIVQNYENHTHYYRTIIEQIEREFEFIPGCLRGINQPGLPILSINAGILGGYNISLFKSYVKQAFEFVDANQAHLRKVNLGMFNPVFEQLLLYRLALAHDQPISAAFEEFSESFNHILQVNATPMLNNYIHTVGDGKKNPVICLELEARLKYEYPEVHKHISELYRQQKITRLTFAVRGKKKVHLPVEMACTSILFEKVFPGLPYQGIDTAREKTETLMESDAELTNPEKLLCDIFQLEENYAVLAENINSPELGSDVLFNQIFDGLPLLYNCDTDSFLQNNFSISENFRLLVLNYEFTEDIDEAYLGKIINGTITPRETGGRLFLMERRHPEIIYSYLSGWENLLYYFEDNELTGLEIIELIQSGETPFSSTGDNLKADVLNFLVTECFYYRRLKVRSC